MHKVLTLRSGFFTPMTSVARSKAALFGLLLVAVGGEARAVTVHGALVIENATQVGPDRYKAPKDKDWDAVLRFYRNAYANKPGIVFRSIASTPKVKATHIQNTKRGSTWEGINIYETGGEIFVYVLSGEEKVEEAKPKAAAKKKASE